MAKVHVRRTDKVVVISGKDKGKVSEVLTVYPKNGKVLVKDVNIVTKHVKPNRENMQGGLIKQEAPINSSKVMLHCTKCNAATRVSKKLLEDGTKVRVCKKCGEIL
ncbi:50S ribosomal protein L24 [Clostridium sp. ZS2-4]|uniref:50S ribosomal protein L24 n=1 Tax=Clostridium sp. ZS2-4 TaxID=2987703 RepID=UPI00227CDFC9|nr:50S ribosomal protein L24 [Clostridium sp. ZS2-4]MCY6354710.1 50S ribosomal protein L24 [Clostridium sp. ZS2-4]